MNSPATCMAQADLLLLLAEIFYAPGAWTPNDQSIDDADVEALASRAGLDVAPLRSAIIDWQSVDPEAARVEHARLFDGNAACAPNETIYVRRDKGAVLADIAGFYRAFGFELSDTFREKHDHIVAELQFTALLLVLIARAGDADQEQQRDIAESALRGFLVDHLGVWIESFADRLGSATDLPLYGTASRLVVAAWETLRRTHDLADFESTTISPLEETGTPYECGMCLPTADA